MISGCFCNSMRQTRPAMATAKSTTCRSQRASHICFELFNSAIAAQGRQRRLKHLTNPLVDQAVECLLRCSTAFQFGGLPNALGVAHCRQQDLAGLVAYRRPQCFGLPLVVVGVGSDARLFELPIGSFDYGGHGNEEESGDCSCVWDLNWQILRPSRQLDAAVQCKLQRSFGDPPLGLIDVGQTRRSQTLDRSTQPLGVLGRQLPEHAVD